MDMVKSIQTARLELIHASAAILEADMARSPQLADLLNAAIPPDWPQPELAEALPRLLSEMLRKPDYFGWYMSYWVAGINGSFPRTLIGSGGLHGRPDAEGWVEVGYGVLPAFHNLGYATEAVSAIVSGAFASDDVAAVFANTGADNAPSIRLLEKLGFQRAGVGAEPGTVRFEVDRERFRSAGER